MSENLNCALSLREVIRDCQFTIPLYQRNYKWDTQTAEKLIVDLCDEYNKKVPDKKSIGLITLHKSVEDDKCYIVDGQQRFTTLAIIFSLLGKPDIIALSFERDGLSEIRSKAIKQPNNKTRSTDTDRIHRNAKAIQKVLDNYKIITNGKSEEFIEYILDNCIMLQSVMSQEPVQEFMNLNAYKTRFSVCDYVRANLITLNTFAKDVLESRVGEVSQVLSEHTFKTAIAKLYNEGLDILYKGNGPENDKYTSVYKLLTDGNYVTDADSTKESRINILFEKNEQTKCDNGYNFEPDKISYNIWIDRLLKIACMIRLMKQLETDMDAKDYSTAKAIDNFQSIKRKSFFSTIQELDIKELDISLASLLEKYSCVNNLTIAQLEDDSDGLKLANRLFEAFSSSEKKQETDNSAEVDNNKLYAMINTEIADCIRCSGRFMLNRFITEQNHIRNSLIKIPPMLDLTDKENEDINSVSDKIGDIISVKDLFSKYNIRIPVIQRDYCMGAQFSPKSNAEDFLSYLIKHFKESTPITASTILISANEEKKVVYIFDGQQRTYTIYNILVYLKPKDEEYTQDKFIFIGRENVKYGSKYSEYSVNNLYNQLENRFVDVNKDKFYNYLLENVSFIVKQVGNISSAEQFFMDINGGVALKPYEIYKACLCERLKSISPSFANSFILKLENDWLSGIYSLLKIESNDEEDIEEITEIRLVEYLCRYFFKKKKNESVLCFDAINSKSEIVSNTNKYLSVLDEKDFEKVAEIMDKYISCNAKNNTPDTLTFATIESKIFALSSENLYGGLICWITPTENPVKYSYVFYKFAVSFSPNIRKELLRFYSCDINYLMDNIYDRDELIQKAINENSYEDEMVTKNLSYFANISEPINLNFIGGYQIKGICSLQLNHQNEIPLYYTDNITYTYYSYITRPYYLYEIIKDKLSQDYTFIYVDPNKLSDKARIKLPNKKYSIFALSEHKHVEIKCEEKYGDIIGCCIIGEEYFTLTNRTDAYSIKNAYSLSRLIKEIEE